jgi:hypothetical protein
MHDIVVGKIYDKVLIFDAVCLLWAVSIKFN